MRVPADHGVFGRKRGSAKQLGDPIRQVLARHLAQVKPVGDELFQPVAPAADLQVSVARDAAVKSVELEHAAVARTRAALDDGAVQRLARNLAPGQKLRNISQYDR